MAVSPVGTPGVPGGTAIADPATGDVTGAWRSFFTMLARLTGAANAMLGVSVASVPNTTASLPLLTAAANDAAAAAAGVPLGGFYRVANAVQQRLV